MSAHYPIVAVTGSSGAGTSTAQVVFERLFQRMGIQAVLIEGDSFHAYDRAKWRQLLVAARIRGENLSLFGPQGNLLNRLEGLFAEYGSQGTGRMRRYLHTEAEADAAGQMPGTFTPWTRIPEGTELMFYEGLHGGLVTKELDVAGHVDLLVGVVPIINLEWIQKLSRDTHKRGYTPEEVRETILRRMPDYVNTIVPQFSRTDINFQRVPLVDTSNPFVEQKIPTAEESLVVIHCNPQSRIEPNFDALIRQIPEAKMTAVQTVVVPGAAQDVAMELLMGDALAHLMERRRKAWDLSQQTALAAQLGKSGTP